MKSYDSWLFRCVAILALLAMAAVWVGCEGDPNDPQHWIDRLEERAYRAEALENLPKTIRDIEDEAVRAEWEEKATAALIEAYEMDANRNEIVQALLAWNRPEAGKIYLRALTEWKEGVTDNLATTAASAAGKLKMKEAVAPMLPMLEADSMFLRKSAAAALGDVGSPEVVEPLMKVMLTSADKQDFFINRVAAEKLGVIRDPRSTGALIRGLFMRGRGADLFPFASPSLVAVGPAEAAPKLIAAIEGKDAELNEMAKTLEFNRVAISRKGFAALGMFYEADAATKAFLTKAMETDEEETKFRTSAAVAVGKVGGDEMKALLLKYLADEKTDVPAKLQIQEGLMQLADPSVVPMLLEQCTEKGIVKDLYGNPAHNLRIGAFEAVTLMGGKEDVEKLIKIRDAAEAKTEKEPMYGALAEEFTNKLAGHKVVLACDKDAACYAEKLTTTTDDSEGRVAAWHLAVLGAKDQADALVKALDTSHKETRIAAAFALNRLAPDIDPNTIWAAFQKDQKLARSFGTMQVYRDTLTLYWNLRRKKG